MAKVQSREVLLQKQLEIKTSIENGLKKQLDLAKKQIEALKSMRAAAAASAARSAPVIAPPAPVVVSAPKPTPKKASIAPEPVVKVDTPTTPATESRPGSQQKRAREEEDATAVPKPAVAIKVPTSATPAAEVAKPPSVPTTPVVKKQKVEPTLVKAPQVDIPAAEEAPSVQQEEDNGMQVDEESPIGTIGTVESSELAEQQAGEETVAIAEVVEDEDMQEQEQVADEDMKDVEGSSSAEVMMSVNGESLLLMA